MSPDKERPINDEELAGLVAPAADARTRLIQAGLVAFGLYNFEGASTRELARLAGVNLAAIPYHFGGKQGLYQAVVEHIADNLTRRAGPGLDKARSILDSGRAGPEELTSTLKDLLGSIAEAMLMTPDAHLWVRIMLREQTAPTSAFETLYAKALGPAHTTLAELVARATGREPGDPEAGIRAFSLMGQILVFRAARETIKRRMGWRTIDRKAFKIIRKVIDDNIAAIMRGVRPPDNGAQS